MYTLMKGKKVHVPFFFFNSCHREGKKKRGPLFLSLCTHVCLFLLLLPFSSSLLRPELLPSMKVITPRQRGEREEKEEARPSEGLPPKKKVRQTITFPHFYYFKARRRGKCERCFLKNYVNARRGCAFLQIESGGRERDIKCI